jgi:hypothetical protein
MRLLLDHVSLILVWRFKRTDITWFVFCRDVRQIVLLVRAIAGAPLRASGPITALSQRNSPLIRGRETADLLLANLLGVLRSWRIASTLTMSRVLLLLLLEEHLLLNLLLVQLLRGCQIEVVDYVRNIGDAVWLSATVGGRRGDFAASCTAALIVHVLVVGALSKVIFMIDVLHACECVLLLVIGSDVGRASLIESTGALESFVIVGPVVRRCLSLARAMLQ